jgi:hypothetical protein
MPSFTTIFRAVVMVVVGAVAVKGWQLFGPTNEQVKKTVAQAIDMAKSVLPTEEKQNNNAMPDPRSAGSQLGANPAPPTLTAQAPASSGQSEAPKLLPGTDGAPRTTLNQTPVTAPPAPPSQPLTASGDRMPELMARLQKLGADNTSLAPWGNSGRLYRFSCRAPLVRTPAMTQHFESVATEPTVAVEEVLAKVEAWRVAQRDATDQLSQRRY